MAGYSAGGFDGSNYLSVTNKFTFPADTRTTITSLAQNKYAAAGFANNGVSGYVCGGYGTATPSNTIDNYAFPSDTFSTLGIVLSGGGAYVCAGMANDQVAGYIGGGVDGVELSRVDKVSFPSNTKSTTTSLSAARYDIGACADVNVAGYFGGGYGTAGRVATVNRMSFPSDTVTTITALTTARSLLGAFSNQGDF